MDACSHQRVHVHTSTRGEVANEITEGHPLASKGAHTHIFALTHLIIAISAKWDLPRRTQEMGHQRVQAELCWMQEAVPRTSRLVRYALCAFVCLMCECPHTFRLSACERSNVHTHARVDKRNVSLNVQHALIREDPVTFVQMFVYVQVKNAYTET